MAQNDAYQFCLGHMVDLATMVKKDRQLKAVTTTDIDNLAVIRMSICPRPEGMEIPMLELWKAMFAGCAVVNETADEKQEKENEQD